MLEFDITIPENFVQPLKNYLVYVPGSATADVYVSGKSIRMFFLDWLIIKRSGDVAGPYFWKGLTTELTSDNLIYKTFAPADGALVGFGSMIYDIIYLRQGHGGRGFDQSKLVQLLQNANIGNHLSFEMIK